MSNSKSSSSAEGFLGSVFKYSVSTFVNIALLGLSMVLTGLFIAPALNSQISIFINFTGTIMTIAILGLDQAFLRFYNEPPKGLSPKGIFRICFYFSSGIILLAGIVCSTLLLQPIYTALGFSMVGPVAVPLLFLNALFYMIARYFNVLFRMEGNILLYTAESILMQFFYKLFYVSGVFFGTENPALAMMLCSVLGLGVFTLAFCFFRRKTLRPRAKEFRSGGYKTVLPYGFGIAPTAVFVTLNTAMAGPLLIAMLGQAQSGTYSYAYALSNVVAMVQLGFASYWGPYMFANYKTQQPRIKRVHNYLNLVILVFFSFLIIAQDIIFLLFRQYAAAQPIFPLMMLSAVFTIMCETTVYGNAIARRPIFDTIGIGISFGVNMLTLILLVPPLGLYGAAIAIVAANFSMFFFRTLVAQRFYSSIESPSKTVMAVILAVAVTVGGTVFAGDFWLKAACGLAGMLAFSVLYHKELLRFISLGVGILKKLFSRG